jgi:hypothetical protein
VAVDTVGLLCYILYADTFDNISSPALKVCPRTETQASSFMRCMCCIKSEVQQTASHLRSLRRQWLSVHLWRLEEAWKAGPDTEEEPRWDTLYQSLQTATIAGWQ